jgi:hypothetical protein
MKTSVSFYSGEPKYLVRSRRLRGRRNGFYQQYTLSCCQVTTAVIHTSPPQPNIRLKVAISEALGRDPNCRYHGFTVLSVLAARLTNEKPAEFELDSATGETLVLLRFHKPFYCPCLIYLVLTTTRGNSQVHKLHAVIKTIAAKNAPQTFR